MFLELSLYTILGSKVINAMGIKSALLKKGTSLFANSFNFYVFRYYLFVT